jgi:hypothetical protein
MFRVWLRALPLPGLPKVALQTSRRPGLVPGFAFSGPLTRHGAQSRRSNAASGSSSRVTSIVRSMSGWSGSMSPASQLRADERYAVDDRLLGSDVEHVARDELPVAVKVEAQQPLAIVRAAARAIGGREADEPAVRAPAAGAVDGVAPQREPDHRERRPVHLPAHTWRHERPQALAHAVQAHRASLARK